ncbi:MAG: sigma-70 family RNA polymerase sigma factor [Pseudomonadota bacterium]
MSESIRQDLIAILPKLRRFAFALAGNRSEGDDIVQTACEKALDRAHQFKPGTRFESWMYRIVQTTFLDSRRRHDRRFAHSDDDALAALSDAGTGAARPQDRLLLARVREAMAALPEDQRAVLALVAIEGLGYREASEVLDVPMGTVMSRLARARAKLKPLQEGAFS